MKFFGTCWDWKSDAPIGEIGDRVNDLLRMGAREIGLHLADGGADDTYCLIICDQRELERAFVEELWDEWWKALLSDEPEDGRSDGPTTTP